MRTFQRFQNPEIRDWVLEWRRAAQKTLDDGDEPIAIVDFFYAPRIVIFVDGSPHYRDHIILAITGDQLDDSLETLSRWLE